MKHNSPACCEVECTCDRQAKLETELRERVAAMVCARCGMIGSDHTYWEPDPMYPMRIPHRCPDKQGASFFQPGDEWLGRTQRYEELELRAIWNGLAKDL